MTLDLVDRPARGLDRCPATTRHQFAAHAGREPAAGNLHGRQRRLPTGRAASSMPTACISTCGTRWAQYWGPTCSRRRRATKGLVRFHPDVMQQVGEGRGPRRGRVGHFQPLGIPRYRMQMGSAEFTNAQTSASIGQGTPSSWTPRNRAAGRRSPRVGLRRRTTFCTSRTYRFSIGRPLPRTSTTPRS